MFTLRVANPVPSYFSRIYYVLVYAPRLDLLRNTTETAGLRVGHVCKYTPLPLALVSCVLHQNLRREEIALDSVYSLQL